MNLLRTLSILLLPVLAACEGSGAARDVASQAETSTEQKRAVSGKSVMPSRDNRSRRAELRRIEARIAVLHEECRKASPQFPFQSFPTDIFDRMTETKARIQAAKSPLDREQAEAELKSLTEQLDRIQLEMEAMEPLIHELKHLEANHARLNAELDRAGN